MKQHDYLLAFIFITIFTGLRAQVITSTYYTGFDNAAEQAGWVQYRKGATGSANFAFDPNNAYSGPDCLYHPYPVGGTQETNDWFVSPVFDFSMGGVMDSLRCAFGGPGVPSDSDLVAVYLLNGAQDPYQAAYGTILLFFGGSNYVNDNHWRKFSNITIPAISGPSYIPFNYKTVVNWLDVRFDNLTVRAMSTGTFTGIQQQEAANPLTVLFPNPVKRNACVTLRQKGSQKQQLLVKLFNSVGELVFEKAAGEHEDQLTLDQPAGIYAYQVVTINGLVLRSGRLIVE